MDAFAMLTSSNDHYCSADRGNLDPSATFIAVTIDAFQWKSGIEHFVIDAPLV